MGIGGCRFEGSVAVQHLAVDSLVIVVVVDLLMRIRWWCPRLWQVWWALRLHEIQKGIKMQQSNKMEMVNKKAIHILVLFATLYCMYQGRNIIGKIVEPN